MKKIKYIIYIFTFVFLFCCIYKTLSFKYGDGIIPIRYMYEQDNIDILILGSSHAFEDINTATLYDDFGYASYIAGGAEQPYWNSYYYLCESLQYHSPKLVILEAYGSVFTDTYSEHSKIIKNNLGIKDYSTRLESLMISSNKSEFENYVLNYRLWHARYEELSSADFSIHFNTPKFQYHKGLWTNHNVEVCERPMVDQVSESTPMTSKSEEYYLKIINLCKEQNIPLMIVVSPYILTEKHQAMYNYSNQLATENGIPFINFNSSYYYDKMSLNFETDFADPSHLNHIGNVKFTKLLGEEIDKLYDIPDRRGDENYTSYVSHSKTINRENKNYNLANTSSISDFLYGISSENDYCVLISFVSNSYDSDFKLVMSAYPKLEGYLDGIYDNNLVVIDDNTITIESDMVYRRNLSYDSNDIQCSSSFINSGDEIAVVQSMSFNGQEYIDNQKGCYIMVYDKFEKSLVTVKQITYDENNELVLITK